MVKTITNPAVSAREAAELKLSRYSRLYNIKKEIEEALKKKLEPVNAEMKEIEQYLEQFADESSDLFEGKKSIKMACGVIGYRSSVGTLSFGLDTDMAEYQKVVKKFLPDAIETKVNSGLVVRGCKINSKLSAELQKLGVEVKQEDKFYVTPA